MNCCTGGTCTCSQSPTVPRTDNYFWCVYFNTSLHAMFRSKERAFECAAELLAYPHDRIGIVLQPVQVNP